MKLTSEFALLSIREGRNELAAHFEERPTRIGPCPEHLRIPVTIVGYIESTWGHDDGTDQEFSVVVEHLSLKQAKVEYTAHVSLGHPPNPTFNNLPEAIARAAHERTIDSYARPGAKRLSSISRTITVGETLFRDLDPLPAPAA